MPGIFADLGSKMAILKEMLQSKHVFMPQVSMIVKDDVVHFPELVLITCAVGSFVCRG